MIRKVEKRIYKLLRLSPMTQLGGPYPDIFTGRPFYRFVDNKGRHFLAEHAHDLFRMRVPVETFFHEN